MVSLGLAKTLIATLLLAIAAASTVAYSTSPTPTAAGEADGYVAAYILVLSPAGGVGWPPPGLLQLLTTRACEGGFIAVYGVDGTPWLAVVYVERGAQPAAVLGSCAGLVGTCFPGTRVRSVVPLVVQPKSFQPQAAEVAAKVANLTAGAAVPAVTATLTTTAPTVAQPAQAPTTAATKSTATAKPVVTAAVRTTAKPGAGAASTAVGQGEAHPIGAPAWAAPTSTPTSSGVGWTVWERLVTVLGSSLAVTLLVYLAWRMRS